ncbi:MAG: flippase-like domain-containing protein [Chitinophagaceae bacterium]|nr:flippase-like domain-containing protein [Chitinophagaceae bacterium]
MKKKALTLLQYAIFFGLGFALIYWQYTHLSEQDIAELKVAIGQVSDRSWLFIPILIIGFFSHFFRALRWRLMLEPLNLRPALFNITAAVFIGYLTNLLLPRMGEVAKCTVLAKYENEPADKIIGTIVAERAFDLICLMLIAALTFAVQADIMTEYLQTLIGGMEGKNLPLKIGVAFIALAAFIGLLVIVYKKNKDGKVGHFIKGLAEGVGSIMAMKKRVQFIVYTILVWGCYLSLIYIGFLALPATEHLGIGAALSILVFGSLGMIVTPGGLGAYPQAIQLVLNMLYGVKSAFGLAFGWISWLAQTLIMVIFGVIAFIFLPIYNRPKNEQ